MILITGAPIWSLELTNEAILYFDLTMTISGEGAGTAEIGATASSAEDTGGQSGFTIQNPTSGGTIPRFTLVGHTAAVPFIYHAEVLSEPGDGTSYKVGDAIDILFLITQLSGSQPERTE